MSTCESGEWALATGARLAESGGGGGPSGLRNIVLTGFMGSGKTTVGSILADRLGREFIDTDAVIESSSGPIAGIVAASGWPAFRAMEREVASGLAGRSGLVIATGGRLMLDAECAACLEPGTERRTDLVGSMRRRECVTAGIHVASLYGARLVRSARPGLSEGADAGHRPARRCGSVDETDIQSWYDISQSVL